MRILKRTDVVRPGRTPLEADTTNQTTTSVEQSYALEMGSQTASVGAEDGVALVLLRRKSRWNGFFGHAYFLERRLPEDGEGVPGRYALYGGMIERDLSQPRQDQYEMTKKAAVRELEEETGLKFAVTDLDEVLSGFTEREGTDSLGIEVFIIYEDKITKKIKVRDIEAYQHKCRAEAQQVDADIASIGTPSNASEKKQLAELEIQKKELKEKTSAGPPVKVRRMWGRWWMFSQPFFELPWDELSPLAAYALLADASYYDKLEKRG